MKLYLLRLCESKLMFGRVSSKMMKLGERWDIQQVLITYPAFRGNEFKGKELDATVNT